jgi:hypothetical protein
MDMPTMQKTTPDHNQYLRFGVLRLLVSNFQTRHQIRQNREKRNQGFMETKTQMKRKRKLPQVELHPAFEIQCECGKGLICRLLEDIEPPSKTLCPCGRMIEHDEIIEGEVVFWCYCEKCSEELLFTFDRIKGGFLIPKTISCECGCKMEVDSSNL